MGPCIRKVLNLSTAHLPEKFRNALDQQLEIPGCIVYPITYGALLWVPDDPKDSNLGGDEDVPPEILALQLYARGLGCDYVLLDADGPINTELPVFDPTGAPPYDAATATGMYDHD